MSQNKHYMIITPYITFSQAVYDTLVFERVLDPKFDSFPDFLVIPRAIVLKIPT